MKHERTKRATRIGWVRMFPSVAISRTFHSLLLPNALLRILSSAPFISLKLAIMSIGSMDIPRVADGSLRKTSDWSHPAPSEARYIFNEAV